ncbi:tetratricopeptide repeat protein [Winogradskyella aurantia]|uniref:Aerotolerance regulator BatC n=1 Tax=Winogradskyella aurantia TaxID=1915063 RepID=A0A265V099_9FLAO|nr:tetratricopeptide repeat protein [Winogradskyella aurantia]OZV70998.1 aerotolerance regulator BatC [Winogradskyella aurantia]
MRYFIVFLGLLVGLPCFAQDGAKEKQEATKKADAFVYKANELLQEDNYIEAEMAYRKAISEAPNKAVGAYNLAHTYYEKGNIDEALFRGQEAAKNAKTKEEKHRAFHNIGNFLMKNEKCKEAVEAYKNALRSDPSDEQTRYNFALAKECAEQQKQDGGGEDNKEDKNKDQEQDKQEDQKKQDDNKENQDQKDEGDQDKKKGDQEEDEDGKPKDDNKDQGKGDDDKDDKNKKPKPKPGQMSPQQIKNILEAMQNQEQKVQAKMNAEKQKGAKVKTEKDW